MKSLSLTWQLYGLDFSNKTYVWENSLLHVFLKLGLSNQTKQTLSWYHWSLKLSQCISCYFLFHISFKYWSVNLILNDIEARNYVIYGENSDEFNQSRWTIYLCIKIIFDIYTYSYMYLFAYLRFGKPQCIHYYSIELNCVMLFYIWTKG